MNHRREIWCHVLAATIAAAVIIAGVLVLSRLPKYSPPSRKPSSPNG
jgi:hypothetical protein